MTADAADPIPVARELRLRERSLSLERTLIMGVVNVTPDSFSDGGLYEECERAADRALEMEAEGADIIDVGGESTRPHSRGISAAEEWSRLGPVLEGLAGKLRAPLSIDTFKPEVARRALAAGAHLVNDITGLEAPEMVETVARAGAGAVVMHMLGRPQTMQDNPVYEDVVGELIEFFTRRCRGAQDGGIPRESLIIDPGIGFGKNLFHNLEILRRLPEFLALGYPLLIGASRKSFLGRITGRGSGERLEASLGAACWAASAGAQIMRVHDVKETRLALAVVDAIRSGQVEDLGAPPPPDFTR